MAEFLDAEIWFDLAILVSLLINVATVFGVERFVKIYNEREKITNNYVKECEETICKLDAILGDLTIRYRDLITENNQLRLELSNVKSK